MESPYNALSPPHDVLATSQEYTLSDMIEIMRRLNINSAPTHSTNHLEPSQNVPRKWLKKKLESVHLDDIGKRRTRSFVIQGGGD